MEKIQKFTAQEISQFDGKNGKPAYIAYKGKVYDVTDSYQWVGGEHLEHVAGQDLTKQMDVAPHGEEVMERMKIVGILVES